MNAADATAYIDRVSRPRMDVVDVVGPRTVPGGKYAGRDGIEVRVRYEHDGSEVSFVIYRRDDGRCSRHVVENEEAR